MSLLGCYTLLIGKQLLLFWMNVMLSPSASSSRSRVYQLIWCNILEDLNLQQHHIWHKTECWIIEIIWEKENTSTIFACSCMLLVMWSKIQKFWVIKCCTLAPDTFGFSVQGFTACYPLSPRVFMWLAHF